MNKYKVTVKHDQGIAVLEVMATSIMNAAKLIKEAEGCPDNAILSIVGV